mgnify:CR=1 FL=1
MGADEVLATYPRSLSPSRANDFLTCPLLFRYRSIDRLPEPGSPAALRGTLVHSALETLFDLPPGDRTVAAAADLLQSAWMAMAEQEPAAAAVLLDELGLAADSEPASVASAVLQPARPLLETYFRMEDPRRLEPHARELGLRVGLTGDFDLRGVIDRVDRAPNGDIRIVDYKTGRSPRAGYESKAMFQMRFYALAWWRMTGNVPKLLQLIYLGSGDMLRYVPTEDDLVATERKVLAVREAINRAAITADFTPNPSKLCGWCAHQPVCPQFGGTPPLLPDPALWPTTSRADEEAVG